MRSHLVVLPEPLIDDCRGLARGCKLFPIQNLSAERSIKAFIVIILPRRARVDLYGLDANAVETILEGIRGKSRTIMAQL
jgi:hypothetical protein